MLDKAYKYALGMGRWCGVAQNVRRHFKIAKAYPLDWWIVEWESLELLLSEDFAQLFQPENLAVDTESNNVFCAHYGIQHAHDFIRDVNGHLIDDLAGQVPLLQEKYRSLLDRMDLAFAGSEVLVVRESLRTTRELEAGISAAETEARARRLLAVLAARWPTTRIDLLVLEGGADRADIPVGEHRIAIDSLEDLNEAGQWRAEAWDRVFERQAVRPMGARTPLAQLAQG